MLAQQRRMAAHLLRRAGQLHGEANIGHRALDRMVDVHAHLAMLAMRALEGLGVGVHGAGGDADRSEEHTSELQSLMRISYAVFCLKKQNTKNYITIFTQRAYNNHKYAYHTNKR